MFTDEERQEIDANLKVIQLEFLKMVIKYMPWLLTLLSFGLAAGIYFDNCG